MGIVRVLKRKDGASLVVGVVLALIVSQFLSSITTYLAGMWSGLDSGQYGTAFPGTGWHGEYLYPAVWAALQIIALELLIWVYVWIRGAFNSK